MIAPRFLAFKLAMVTLAALLFAACGGGSGSSGFDSLAAENAAIERALSGQQCEMHDGLTICPAPRSSDNLSPTPGTPSSATPTPGGAPGVVALVDQRGAIACSFADGNNCLFDLTFIPRGFPASATFRVAVRNTDPDSEWRITAPALPNNAGSPDAGLMTTVEADDGARDSAQSAHVQLAVLVFLTPPAALPETVATLADTGADFAFVSEAIAIAPAS